MNSALRRLTLVLLLVVFLPTTSRSADLTDLNWLVGTWKRETPRGTTFEMWQRVSDRTLEGESWIVSSEDGKKHSLESLLLVEMAGELFYISKVDENEYPVPFKRTSMEPGQIVFENPSHDFPRKIVYRREGEDGLLATIEGPGRGGAPKQVEFRFER